MKPGRRFRPPAFHIRHQDMSKNKDQRIAEAIGVKPEQVSQLCRRGMPRSPVAKAVDWFNKNGMRQRSNKPHHVKL